MDCRETQTMLTAFHDGELPSAERARVEEHLRDCRACTALLSDLARVDRAAGVPDPGPAYWDRFNERVMDRVEREADGPKVAVLRPKGGWMRQQLRYLVPAAAAAALVVMVVHYGGMHPGAPTPAAPPAVSSPEPEPRATKMAEGAVVSQHVSLPAVAKERFAAVTRTEQDHLAERSVPARNEDAKRDRAEASSPVSGPSPTPPMTFRGAPAGSPPVPTADGFPSGMRAERKKMAGESALMAKREIAGKAISASASPCELAHALAEEERWKDAETAQRTCLSEGLPAAARERGLVFLAELLDRQERFSEADAVIAEVDLRFPRSRLLDLYRQRRPMVRKRPE